MGAAVTRRAKAVGGVQFLNRTTVRQPMTSRELPDYVDW